MHIVTEVCNGGNMFDKLLDVEHFTENQAAYYFKQIISAVCYFHR